MPMGKIESKRKSSSIRKVSEIGSRRKNKEGGAVDVGNEPFRIVGLSN